MNYQKQREAQEVMAAQVHKLHNDFEFPNIIPVDKKKVPRIIDILYNEAKQHGKKRKTKRVKKDDGCNK